MKIEQVEETGSLEMSWRGVKLCGFKMSVETECLYRLYATPPPNTAEKTRMDEVHLRLVGCVLIAVEKPFFICLGEEILEVPAGNIFRPCTNRGGLTQ